jgi:N4-gp56 family major capsid protein
MEISIEEVLEYQDLPSELKTWVISDEIIESARTPLVMTPLLAEKSLVGEVGRRLVFPVSSHLTATAISDTGIDDSEPETELASSGYSPSDKTITYVNVDVDTLVYCAVELSDVLQEDMPKIDWVRLNLRNMGLAIGEYIETAVRDLLLVGAGQTLNVTGDLLYGDIIDGLAQLKNLNIIAKNGYNPYLVVAPDTEKVMLKDKEFISTMRYTTADLANIVNGESGMYAGCRVLVSPLLDGMPYALLVFDSNAGYGTTACIVYKRPLRTRSERDEKAEKTFLVSSTRYGLGVVQANFILKFQLSNTP